jgi:hypothetical protein
MRLGSAVHSIILEPDTFEAKYAIEPERWPTKAEWFSRVKDDGRADAALLAWWGSRFGS